MSEDGVQAETLTIEFKKAEDTDHSVNAEAVAASIQAVTSLVNRIHDEFEKDKQFLVRARPLKGGSLEIPLDLLLFVGGMLLTEAPLFDKIRDVLKQFVDLKIRLGGKSFS
ncbi:MAG: hypothetical protein JXL80_01520, partial [Planctomycetes bacterium]|nr:hypothetical protein [Planctomycetota bacterium]